MLDVPESVRQRWADKAESIQGLGDLALPYPSSVGRAMAGHVTDRDLLASLQWVIKKHPSELPLDVAPARCKRLDREFLGAYTGPPPGLVKGAEASWVATDESFMYVAPRLAMYRRWPWESVEIKLRKRGRRVRFSLIARNDSFDFKTGGLAMANLMTVHSWVSR